MSALNCAALIAAALILFPSTTAGQTNSGELSGVVLDASGGVLPGATVTATHPASGTVVARVTDAEGRFFLPALRVGVWDLMVALTGFAPQTRTGILLEIGAALTLDFRLDVEGLSESLTVAANASLLQTATAEISDVIENREVVQLPLNGRNFLALAQLSDAVVLPPGGTRGDALQQAGPLPNVGGQRSGHNIYLLDGAKVTDELFNNLAINPSVDSIQEFRIQKSMYPAEFGGKASALINVSTKAGGNTFSGSVFEFHRNDAFDAANYFHPANQPVPPLRQNQFGGSLGGPLARNRSFFFASYEGTRMRRSLTRAFSVPTAAVRSGNFAGFPAICDPLTIPAAGVCVPFAGNQIPAGRLDPIAVAFLQQVPLPTSGAAFQNLTSIEASTRELDQFSARIDHRLGDNDQLFGRFSTFDAEDLQPFGTSALQESIVPGFGRSLTTDHAKRHGQRKPRVRQFNAERGTRRLDDGRTAARRASIAATRSRAASACLASRAIRATPASRRCRPAASTARWAIRRSSRRARTGTSSCTTTSRSIAAGIDGSSAAITTTCWLRPEQPDNARGAFTYTGQFTGNALADFLLGYPTSASVGIGRGDEDGRTNWLHAYVQDDWRARENLTLNLGLRYEFNQHMYDVNNRLSSIDLSTPGGRFVIASDDSDAIHPARVATPSVDPDSVRDLEPGRMGTRTPGSEHCAAGAPRRVRAHAR